MKSRFSPLDLFSLPNQNCIQDLNTQTLLTASNGRKVPALTIFTYALQYFKEHALHELTDQSGTRFVNEDVRWVITVPAIWKQSAKQFMREAAYQVCAKLMIK